MYENQVSVFDKTEFFHIPFLDLPCEDWGAKNERQKIAYTVDSP